MTYFPRKPSQRLTGQPSGPVQPARSAELRDVLWNRPVFRAPHLPSPRVAFDPLPFTAVRVTNRSAPQP
jgi:hypothetical protein